MSGIDVDDLFGHADELSAELRAALEHTDMQRVPPELRDRIATLAKTLAHAKHMPRSQLQAAIVDAERALRDLRIWRKAARS